MTIQIESSQKPLLQALNGGTPDRVPLWLMRQAGRYLPEYRKVRASVGDFLELCFTPELAAEVTLQPLRRYGMDGAVLFSDILVIPYALGQPGGSAGHIVCPSTVWPVVNGMTPSLIETGVRCDAFRPVAKPPILSPQDESPCTGFPVRRRGPPAMTRP